MMTLEDAVKVLLARYEGQVDIELKEQLTAAKSQHEIREAMANGALEALRSLRPAVQEVYFSLYPTPDARLGFILESFAGQDLKNLRLQARNLKANEQYHPIGVLIQRALDLYEVMNEEGEET